MNDVLVTYMNTSNTTAPMLIKPGITVSLDNVQPNGNEFNFASTLNISKASVLGSIEVMICNGGSQATASNQTVRLRCEFLDT